MILQGEVVATKNLRLLVDAEYSYINPGCSLIALAMMAAFNQKSPVVANTYQCYFKVSAIFFMTEFSQLTVLVLFDMKVVLIQLANILI